MSSKTLGIFGILSVTLFGIETALSVDFSGSIVAILLHLDIFAVLILWHIGLGVIAPRLREMVWEETDLYDDPQNEQSHGFLPYWVRLGLPVLLAAEIMLVVSLLNGPNYVDLLTLLLYILLPSFLLLYRSWVTTFIAVIVVWFPIEYGVIDHVLGDFSMTLIPLDALIGIFSLLWPFISHGRHIPWYHWDLTGEDLRVVAKVSGLLTIAIVPLGILTKFITINPSNFLDPEIAVDSNPLVNSVVYALLVFYLIFIVQGLMEETLFRDVIFKHQYYWLKDRWERQYRLDPGYVIITLAGILVMSIPFWDNALTGMANLFPIFEGLASTIGNMALPLGEYEGIAIDGITQYPLWWFYVLVGLLLTGMGYGLYRWQHTPLMATLIVSSIIFGFAHFQDFRYVFFASIAGFGYGYAYYQTKNLVPAAMVHMGVDAIWVLLLSY